MLQEAKLFGGRDMVTLSASLQRLGTIDPRLASDVRNGVIQHLTPVEQGELLRTTDATPPADMALLQRDNFAAYVEKLRPTLAPQDQNNPFAYSLSSDVPIEVKRQVYAEYLSGQNAPGAEIGSMAGANASFDESKGPNGMISINGALLGNSDPALKGQFEAFAVWGHLEEIGHWGDMRAQQIMGRPGGDSLGDEGARFAMMSLPGVTAGGTPQNGFIGSYDIKLSNGTTRTVQFDTVVLKALAAEKLASGSFARENRIGNVEHFGPEGHYQTTYLTAVGVATAIIYSRLEDMSASARNAEIDKIANRLALGSQLPDMLEHYDAKSQYVKTFVSSTPEEKQHLISVYRGLHGLPYYAKDATISWRDTERIKTTNFIKEAIANSDFVTAGVAIHRLGDHYAHTDFEGKPFPGGEGHGAQTVVNTYSNGTISYNPDDMYNSSARIQNMRDYQKALSIVISEGLTEREYKLGYPTGGTKSSATDAGVALWSEIFNRNNNEIKFKNDAARIISEIHKNSSQNEYKILKDKNMDTKGGYKASADEIKSLDKVMNALKE